jgi:hypothetical protein
MELVSNHVVVGLGCEGMWSASARNLPFNIGWVSHLYAYHESSTLKTVNRLLLKAEEGFQRKKLSRWVPRM